VIDTLTAKHKFHGILYSLYDQVISGWLVYVHAVYLFVVSSVMMTFAGRLLVFS